MNSPLVAPISKGTESKRKEVDKNHLLCVTYQVSFVTSHVVCHLLLVTCPLSLCQQKQQQTLPQLVQFFLLNLLPVYKQALLNKSVSFWNCFYIVCRLAEPRMFDYNPSLKATESLRGSVEKLSSKVLQLKVCPRKIPMEPGHYLAAQCRHPRKPPEETVFFQTAPRMFNSCWDNQNHEVHLSAYWFYPPADCQRTGWLYWSLLMGYQEDG